MTQMMHSSTQSPKQILALGDEADQQTANFAHHPKSTSEQKPVQKGGRKRKLGDGGSLAPPSKKGKMPQSTAIPSSTHFAYLVARGNS